MRGLRAVVLALERLSDADVEALARATLDAPSLPDGLGRLLASRAEGVPFLVEEVLASCVASGALVRERGVCKLRTDRAPRVPETLQGMMRERLRSLGEQDRAVLGAAAVLGRRFDCLGSCWALMLVMFAVGLESLLWMAVLATVMTVERVTRRGSRLAPLVGLALISVAVIGPLHTGGLL